jgi:hypothetical protein
MKTKLLIFILTTSIALYSQINSYVFKTIEPNFTDSVKPENVDSVDEKKVDPLNVLLKKKYDENRKKLIKNRDDSLNSLTSKYSDITDIKDHARRIQNKYNDSLLKNTEYYTASLEYEYISKNLLIDKWFKIFFVKNGIDAELFFEKETSASNLRIFRNTQFLVIPTDTPVVSLFTELYSDYWGPVRTAIGMQFSNAITDSIKDSTKKEDSFIKDKISLINGGNACLDLQYPIFLLKSKGSLGLFSGIGNISCDLPNAGTSLDNPIVRFNLGFNFWETIKLQKDNIMFAISGKTCLLYSTDKDALFKYSDDNEAFFMHTINLGIIIKSAYRINYSWNIINKGKKTKIPNSISLTIVPDL